MRIDVFPCNDGLEARLTIKDFNPADWSRDLPHPAALFNLIAERGLDRDRIDLAAVASIHQTLTEACARAYGIQEAVREVQTLGVAGGVAPVDEEVEGLLFHKSYYAETHEVEAVKSRLVREGWESLSKTIDSSHIVQAGQTILSFSSLKPAEAGRDVFGKAISYKPYTAFLPEAGNSLEVKDGSWSALKDGILILEDNRLKIIGADASMAEILRVSPDKMKVSLVLVRELLENDGLKPTLELIHEGLSKMGLTAGIPSQTLADALLDFLANGTECDLALVEGVPARESVPGRMELLIDPEPDLPDPDTAAKVDFKSFTFFKTVRAGQELARIIPPQPGVAGRDVFGNAILPKAAQPRPMGLGKNTQADPADPSRVLACCDGKITVAGGIPEVVDTLEISEDVSLKTGNVSFPGSIEVKGDIRDNLLVEAKGDVGISGVVEDGTIVSEGAIVVKGGFSGTGKGVIKSKLSSVTIGYIRNQRIESHSNIIVYNEVVNAILMARKSVIMKSSSHSVVGGRVLAYDNIEIHNAGNEGGIKTFLEVGTDFEVEAEIAAQKERLARIQDDIQFMEAMLEKIGHIVRWEGGTKPENRLLEQRTKGVAEAMCILRKKIMDGIADLQTRLFNPGDCSIAIRGIAYPGTVLKYRDKTVLIPEKMQNKRWMFRGTPAPTGWKPAPAQTRIPARLLT
jgi:uncharacterized protein (DUF342 family)